MSQDRPARDDANREVHIASFVVQHRPQADAALAAMMADCPDLELGLAGETRSVVICESDDRYLVMDRIEQLRAVPGVLNVLLVYHHAEPRQALELPLSASQVKGVQP
ncbi:MAG TPA: chaperone NapD [Pseudoxanthomonas sp.]|jgi:nitrate reductase NapD|nr:chaperone NapD [Pseudoxanthomonas sp.]